MSCGEGGRMQFWFLSEPIFSTGKCVVLDSGLFVSKGDHSLVRRLASTLLRSLRSKNTGPRVYREMPWTNNSPIKDVTHLDMLELITEEVPEGKHSRFFVSRSQSMS